MDAQLEEYGRQQIAAGAPLTLRFPLQLVQGPKTTGWSHVIFALEFEAPETVLAFRDDLEAWVRSWVEGRK